MIAKEDSGRRLVGQEKAHEHVSGAEFDIG